MRYFKIVALAVLLVLAGVLFRGSKEGVEPRQFFGNCPENSSTAKIDEAGSNCFGWCPYSNTYKTDKDGTNCIMYPWGYCNQFPDRPKLDAEGSNCVEIIPYQVCSDNKALKTFEGATNCFGWCPTSEKQQRKVYKWPWEQCPAL